MVFQTGPRVVRSNSCKGPVYPGKGQKKPKGQTKILGPASFVWDQISEFWPQKGQPCCTTTDLGIFGVAFVRSLVHFEEW